MNLPLMNDSNSINEIIRILRNLRGYKQSFMAKKLGISQQDYSHIETRGKKISNEQLISICRILGVHQDFLTEFDPELFFRQMLQGQETGIPEDLLKELADKGELFIVLKAYIVRMHDNLRGLRNQLKEQNQTIKDLREALLRNNLDKE